MVVLDRYLRVDLDRRIERPRQWHVLDNRNLVRPGGLPDLEGDVVDALGDADRRRHAALIGQRHRIVGRVGDDHRGLGHRGHHALAHARVAQLLDLALDVRIAFGLLELLLHFLQRHLLPLIPLPILEQIVADRDDREQRDHRPQ